MPPDVPISIRRTKLKAEEAALIAGELTKPSWESRNEGIHERVNFEDCIWGFDLAGGAYYRTPLRVTYVKPDSRAQKAGIRPGDKLLRINDIDTSTLTIQEAHKIIIDSGIHLRLAVTSPEDEVDSYYCYEDPVVDDEEEEERRRIEEEKAKKRQVHAKVSSFWSLQWPWVSKRKIIYRESNCFMVPSKYESKHRDKFPEQPFHRYEDDIVLQSVKSAKDKRNLMQKESSENESEGITMNSNDQPIQNGNVDNNNDIENGHEDDVEDRENVANDNRNSTPESEEDNDAEEKMNSYNNEIADEVNSISDEKSDEANVEDDKLETQNDESISQNNEVTTDSDEVMENDEPTTHNEVFEDRNSNINKDEEEKILSGILSDSHEQTLDDSESVDER